MSSRRPLVSKRVAANTHVHALVQFNDLWYLTICSTIVIFLFLPRAHECFSSFISYTQQFIVI